VELETVHGSSPKSPLFPKTDVSFGPDGAIMPARLGSEGWANADPIRKLFREACKAAGVPDFGPHSFRHTLARLGQQVCRTPEYLKSWSQNLGHESMLTTFPSYGQVPDYRQRELIRGLSERTSAQ
jgi:integrase